MTPFQTAQLAEAKAFLLRGDRIVEARYPPGSCFPAVCASAYQDVDKEAVRVWGSDVVVKAKAELGYD